MKKLSKINTIGYKPGTARSKTPCIKIANKFLEKCGFKIGDKIKIIYQQGKITILVQND